MFPQHRDFKLNRELIQSGNFFNSELHYFPASDSFNVYLAYKIPFSQLFFEKNNDMFTSGIQVNLEIKDSADNLIRRTFDARDTSVSDFEITNSKDHYLQGLLFVKLKAGKYKLFTIISDKTTKRERNLPPTELEISDSDKILNPIVIKSDQIVCDKNDSFVLSNFSSTIPFNHPNAILAIPVTDSTINSVTIKVQRNDTVLVSDEKNQKVSSCSNSLQLCDNEIIISPAYLKSGIKYFLFNSFSANLTEGPIQIEVTPDNKSVKQQKFYSQVIWIGKPQSLLNAEKAIKYLSVIESDDKNNKMLKSDNLQKELNSYWEKIDPTPATKYNELMNEFYQRVDYCEKSFRFIDGNGGAFSDRGKIYIKYGPPAKISRATSSDDKIVETWNYENPKRTFVFVDNEGTGKYLLVAEK